MKDPITGLIRYVGKSDNPKKRLSSHLGEARDRNCHRKVWLQSLKIQGLRPVLEILDEVPEEEWQSWEVAYIEHFREAGYDLTNNSAGGDGICNPSPATRELMRTRKLGRKISSETRAKMSAARVRISRKDNTSGFVGVCWNKRKQRWIARIFVGKKHLSLGYFKQKEDAVFVHTLAVDKYFSKTS